MVFSNAIFLLWFMPLTGIIYYLIPNKFIKVKNLWLLGMSLIFYAWGEPVYVLLMIASIVANYIFGRIVSKYPKSKKGRTVVAIACIYNLGQLFVFKYLSWILGNIGLLIGKGYALGSMIQLALPIGISFYTFQALSYVIDVYRGKDKAQTNVLNVGLYIAFFPQLIAGPIVRYGSIAEQLLHREHSFKKFSDGVWRFCIGLSKKVLLANQLAVVADKAFAAQGSELSVVFAWAGAFSFMLQIYFDFSGYSDMAIGLGKMFGFEFSENFNYPYISRSISEYWRRWHISLGEWFRDYLYYPLSLGPAIKIRKYWAGKTNRKTAGIISTAFVLFIVWMATGVWHGANWTFVVWGLLQFTFLFWEQYRKPLKNKRLGAVIGWITTILVIIVTKVIFKSDNMSHAMRYYASMLHLNGNVFLDAAAKYWIGQYKVILIAGTIFAFPVVETITKHITNGVVKQVWNWFRTAAMACMLVLCIAYAISGGYNPFIYFNF